MCSESTLPVNGDDVLRKRRESRFIPAKQTLLNRRMIDLFTKDGNLFRYLAPYFFDTHRISIKREVDGVIVQIVYIQIVMVRFSDNIPFAYFIVWIVRSPFFKESSIIRIPLYIYIDSFLIEI